MAGIVLVYLILHRCHFKAWRASLQSYQVHCFPFKNFSYWFSPHRLLNNPGKESFRDNPGLRGVGGGGKEAESIRC